MISVIADPDEQITELDETNNEASTLYQVEKSELIGTMSDLALEWGDISFFDSDGVEITNPATGENITIVADIHNIGLVSSDEEVVVNFYVNEDTFIGATTLTAIQGGWVSTAQLPWTAPDTDGYYVIKVEVEQDDNETYVENNTATHFIVAGSPIAGDAWIEVSETLQPSTTYPGAWFNTYGQAEYVWENGTRLPVLGASVTIRILGQPDEWYTFTATSGNYSAMINAPDMLGTHAVRVTVTDSTLTGISTSDLILIDSCAQDLTASPGQISPDNGTVGETENLQAYIRNVGNSGITQDFEVSYEITDQEGNSVYANTAVINGIGARSGIVRNFGTWTPSASGRYTIRITIDTGNTVAEECSEENNVITSTIYVYPDYADLTPVSITPSSASICTGDEITLSSRIMNIGGLDSAPSNVHFSVDGVELANSPISVEVSKQGASAYTSAKWTPAESGIYEICVLVDDPITGNNLLCSNVNVQATPADPDLWLRSISNQMPFINTPTTISASITNLGCNQSTDGVEVIFSIDGAEIDRPVIPSLLHNESAGASATHIFSTAGAYEICAEVNDPADPNTINNRNCRIIIINTPLPDLWLHSDDIEFTNPNPEPGQDTTILATIHNQGVSEATEYLVTFYEDEKFPINSQTITVPLAPGGTATISTTWTATTEGTHIILVNVTPIVPDNDPNYSNNAATKAIIVGKTCAPGDLNCDGDIDMDDYSLFRSTLGKSEGDPGYIPEADYDGDKRITYGDYRIWYGYFRNQ